jgi:hypothetical protein
MKWSMTFHTKRVAKCQKRLLLFNSWHSKSSLLFTSIHRVHNVQAPSPIISLHFSPWLAANSRSLDYNNQSQFDSIVKCSVLLQLPVKVNNIVKYYSKIGIRSSYNMSRYTTPVTVHRQQDGPKQFSFGQSTKGIEIGTVSYTFSHRVLIVSHKILMCMSVNKLGQLESGFVAEQNFACKNFVNVFRFLKIVCVWGLWDAAKIFVTFKSEEFAEFCALSTVACSIVAQFGLLIFFDCEKEPLELRSH